MNHDISTIICCRPSCTLSEYTFPTNITVSYLTPSVLYWPWQCKENVSLDRKECSFLSNAEGAFAALNTRWQTFTLLDSLGCGEERDLKSYIN